MSHLDSYQSFIHLSRYSRWLPEQSRRETFKETVDRYVGFVLQRPELDTVRDELREAILNLKVMPSMRSLMTAGLAADRDNIAMFNCSFCVIDSPRAFDEILYVLMNGTGVGFSVENQHVTKLPVVAESFHETDTTIVVADSKIGWASAFRELVSLLYVGKVPKWDVSKVRPEGAPLKVFGGRASGPGPLVDLFEFAVKLFRKASGRQLSSLECHDLVCHVASVVVVGGVRRAALISLSDLGDLSMAKAKSGSWWELNAQRAMANNSAVYSGRPPVGQFMSEWQSLYESRSGERGMVNRNSATRFAPRRTNIVTFGTNPCGEICLRPNEFCNLSEVVLRNSDTQNDILEKVHFATILGTIQSTFTDFKYLRSVWKKNCDEERLLGVSFTGICDNDFMSTNSPELEVFLDRCRETAIETNALWAEKLGINPSVAITCIKPSGTASELVSSSSGIHPAYSDHYIRTVRNSITDPISTVLIEAGVPHETDLMNPKSYVFSFPRKANASKTKAHVTALDQLELALTYRKHWCEHNVSVTVYVGENEWLDVAAYAYKHFDDLFGVSFLPKEESDHTYEQAPFQEISKGTYDALIGSFPELIDWSVLRETQDETVSAQMLACSSGVCAVI